MRESGIFQGDFSWSGVGGGGGGGGGGGYYICEQVYQKKHIGSTQYFISSNIYQHDTFIN